MSPSATQTASAPGISFLSRLNGWPAHSPADASPTSSRTPAHGSGPMWVATPSSQRTCTSYSLPVSRRTCVKTPRSFHTLVVLVCFRGLRSIRRKIAKNLRLRDRSRFFHDFLHGLGRSATFNCWRRITAQVKGFGCRPLRWLGVRWGRRSKASQGGNRGEVGGPFGERAYGDLRIAGERGVGNRRRSVFSAEAPMVGGFDGDDARERRIAEVGRAVAHEHVGGRSLGTSARGFGCACCLISAKRLRW